MDSEGNSVVNVLAIFGGKEKTKKVKLRKDRRALRTLPIFVAIFAVAGVIALLFARAATPIQVDASLPQVTNVHAFGDDRNITLTWDAVSSSRVVGYYITYRPRGSSADFTVRQTEHTAIQLQPLTNGQEYEIFVQSASGSTRQVDAGSLVSSGSGTWAVADGKVSNKSGVVYGTPSSARVDAMRQRLTGFFDDFNTAAGPMDELKWNHATTACARAGSAAAFINDQFHAHNTVGSSGPDDTFCDRAGIASRPRAVFDMSNVTEANPGQIEFDIDGASHHRDTWYLDIIPLSSRTNNIPLDITSHNDLFDADSENPGNMLRFNSANDKLTIPYYSSTQAPGTLSLFRGTTACSQSWQGANVARYESCDIGNKTGNFSTLPRSSMQAFPIPNVRRHWVIQLTPTKIRVFVDNALIAVADMPSGFFAQKKFSVHSTVFSYNTGKTDGIDDGQPIPSIEMIHWDNFGFNGPAQPEVAYNYLEGGATGTNPAYANGDSAGYRIPAGSRKTIVPVPDAIGNVVNGKARLYYTVGGFGYATSDWTSSDHVLVNGNRYNVPNPSTVMSQVTSPLSSNQKVTAFALEIDKAHLKQGNNEVEFKFGNSGASFINVHLELPYSTADSSRPTYTQPLQIFGSKFYDISQPPITNCDQYRYVEQDLGLPYQSGKANITTANACVLLPKGSHHNTGGNTTPTTPTPTTNQPPTINLSASQSSLTAPATFSVAGTATDGDGTVARIEIRQGSSVVRTCSATSSCTFNASNIAAGNYSYSAVATDDDGATTTSQTVTVVVSEPTPPPTSNRFSTLAVNAALPSETECASRVRPVAEVRPANQVPNNTRGVGGNYDNSRVTGNYTGTTDEIIQWAACKWGMDEDILRAQMVQESYWHQSAIGDFTSGGASLCSPVYPVKNYPAQYSGDGAHDNQCPESYGMSQVRWTFHKSAFYRSTDEMTANLTNNAIYSTAYNLDYWASVWRRCYNGEYTWLNSFERGRDYTAGDEWGCLGMWFSGRWHTAPAETYIGAVQGNLNGRVWETSTFRNSQPVNTIPSQNPTSPPADTTAPAVSIAAPTNNQTVSGTITIRANASDSVGVTRVSYFLDGSNTAFSNDSTSPYESSWNTANTSNGTHTIRATAIDAAGNIGSSTTITINVQNTVPDTTAPTTNITAPTNGQTVRGTVVIAASAGDNVGVTKVDLLVDGAVAGTDTTGPSYSYSLNTALMSEGTHTFRTRAYDAAGNNGLSGLISVTVDNVPPPTPAPTVSLTANPTSLNSGSASTLTWSSTNATSCTASGGWSGAKGTSGSQSTGNLASSQSYMLSCSGAGGSASASASVSVAATPPPTPTPTPPAVPGDTDGDNTVDRDDLWAVLRNYGRSNVTAYTNSDVTGDGRVNRDDLWAVLRNYGRRL